jgi:hypothetical protein
MSSVERVEAPVTPKAYMACAFAAFGGIFFGFDSGEYDPSASSVGEVGEWSGSGQPTGGAQRVVHPPLLGEISSIRGRQG